ncbi:uncharacterized mitochondrial protein AtMg00310-like [Carya illinoinensis]|uniref:uncharacterized mitochondrial protein AtMg00310-like n=1 Tax=Carya illinoinensis TaxID=32201 RepID=UPI001C7233F8|nr:uncharacterized mitochondrial protein AtMg00310-like [Carya illinoinensis]
MCNNYNKYLGLPTIIGRSKYKSFRELKEKIWKRICSWKTSFLSTAGKEILIKSVLQAIPAYTMSVFKLPGTLVEEIEALLARFWWRHGNLEKGIHWRSWDKLGRAKGRGGMGFRDLGSFNRALLAKQGWRFIKDPNSLASRIFKEKYFQNSGLLEAKLGSGPSFVWRSIWSSLDLVKGGLVWRVGNGESIKI